MNQKIKTFEINLEDAEIVNNDIEGWLVETNNGITVALDTTLTDNLIQEGIAREFVSKLQNMRKDAGLEVVDRINISIEANENIISAIKIMNDYVCNETLCDAISITTLSDENEIDFLDGKIKMSINKA
ncbi:MAG: DUF5915 domain-containing protein [Bacteroidetes bacterium]|nr:DUF5915 domain-containing protein [Bacteroidota bacterium]